MLTMKPVRHRRQEGSSLIEVLIALGLVAVTMLGLLSMQLRTLGFQKDSLDRKTAAALAADFADRVAVNFTGFRNAGYSGRTFNPGDTQPTATSACAGSTCTEVEVARRDWELFQMEVRRRLPGGVAFVDNESADRNAVIVVGWLDPRRADADSGGTTTVDPVCNDVGIDNDQYRCYRVRVAP